MGFAIGGCEAQTNLLAAGQDCPGGQALTFDVPGGDCVHRVLATLFPNIYNEWHNESPYGTGSENSGMERTGDPARSTHDYNAAVTAFTSV